MDVGTIEAGTLRAADSLKQRFYISMGSESVAHHADLNIDALEVSKLQGHGVASCGGLLTRNCNASLNRLLSPGKLLGMLFVAQQFTTASAAGLCHVLNHVHTKFDLIGLISTFGTEAATKSLTYSAMNDDWRYLTGHIGPGSLSVAAVLFEATGFRVAHLFALGGTADAYQVAGLDSPNKLRYIGLKSNTECPMVNAVGACIVREHGSLWEKKETQKPLKDPIVKVEVGQESGKHRDANRKTEVIILEVVGRWEQNNSATVDVPPLPNTDNKTKQEPMLVMLKSGKWDFFLLGWLPLLLTLGVIASCIICKERYVAGLMVLGTGGMFVAVLGLRLCRFQYSTAKPVKNAPEGDCLVVDDSDPDILHIFLGKEEDIQSLFQRKIHCEPSIGKYPLLLAGCMLYVYVIASVLYMPNVSVRGQILFGVANLIGLVMDMVKASKNGSLGFAKKACEQFKIKCKKLSLFLNRTAAVACVAKHARDRLVLKSKKLLPSEGAVWQKWWAELEKCDGSSISFEPQDDLLKRLLDDMMHGLRE